MSRWQSWQGKDKGELKVEFWEQENYGVISGNGTLGRAAYASDIALIKVLEETSGWRD